MSNSENVPIMRQAIPVGFDPMRLLKKAVSAVTGETVLRLELPYKKLWFKKAHPSGRIYVKPLQLNEKIAIYEAQVFLNRDDNVPICSFTSSVSSEGVPNGRYAQKAQDDAVDNALSNAGFGIQIADRYYGSEIPISAYPVAGLKAAPKTASSREKTVVQPPVVAEQTSPAMQVKSEVTTAKAEVKPAPKAEPMVAAVKEPEAETVVKEVSTPKAEPVKASEAAQAEIASMTETVPRQETHAANAALELLRGGNTATAKTDDSDLPFTMGPTYNNEMPVEQIVSIMTLEQAKAVVVDDGLSKGMTMGEVAEKRPASLQFYLSVGYRKKNNILKSAAQILLNERQKAS